MCQSVDISRQAVVTLIHKAIKEKSSDPSRNYWQAVKEAYAGLKHWGEWSLPTGAKLKYNGAVFYIRSYHCAGRDLDPFRKYIKAAA